jgi:hypothetical protein
MIGRRWMGAVMATALVFGAVTAAEAGQVTVKKRAGDLRIRTSGPGAVQIEIESLGGGDFVIRALNPEGTTINGAGSDSFSNVFGDISIRTTDADDLVRVFANPQGGAELRLPGTLAIDVRGGRDLVELIAVRIDDQVRIDLGRGDDGLIIDRAAISDDVSIRGASGDDMVSIFTSTLADDLVLTTGTGADTVELSDTTIGDDARITLGKGDDLFTMTRTPVSDLLKISGGGGVDDLLLDGASANALRLSCGADSDFVTIVGASSFFISRFDGGGRRDTLSDDGTAIYTTEPIVKKFELSDLPRIGGSTGGR